MCLFLASSVCMHMMTGRSKRRQLKDPHKTVVSALWALCFENLMLLDKAFSCNHGDTNPMLQQVCLEGNHAFTCASYQSEPCSTEHATDALQHMSQPTSSATLLCSKWCGSTRGHVLADVDPYNLWPCPCKVWVYISKHSNMLMHSTCNVFRDIRLWGRS